MSSTSPVIAQSLNFLGLGPKRATRIRKFFNLDKKDDVRSFVIKREVTTKAGKTYTKAPKIQVCFADLIVTQQS